MGMNVLQRFDHTASFDDLTNYRCWIGFGVVEPDCQ